MSLQLDLFQERGPGSPAAAGCGAPPELVEHPGLRLRLWSRWLPEPEAMAGPLSQEVPWKQELITLWGRTHPLPRLTCWMGDPGCAYTYSGLRNRIEAWTPAVQRLKARVEAELGVRFNSLLLNRYRHGRDRLHWHADDEPELDPRAPIASLSLGSARSFRLRPRHAPRRRHHRESRYRGVRHGGSFLLVCDGYHLISPERAPVATARHRMELP